MSKRKVEEKECGLILVESVWHWLMEEPEHERQRVVAGKYGLRGADDDEDEIFFLLSLSPTSCLSWMVKSEAANRQA